MKISLLYSFLSLCLYPILLSSALAQDDLDRGPGTATVLDPSPVFTTINSAGELAQVFAQHNYHWPPRGNHPPLVPRLILDDLPAGWNDHLTIVENKSVFIRLLLPLILLTNEQILAQRTRLLDMLATDELSEARESEWYARLREQYRLAPDTAIDEVLRRIDMIPPALAVAQAVLESGWGTSRFVAEGNALYAEWIWGGLGMEPQRQREELGDYGVQSFSSLLRSARSYADNLNSNDDYAEFRLRRAQMRAMDTPLSGCALAGALEAYAELPVQEYSRRLCSIIRDNRLSLADASALAPAPLELLRFQSAERPR